MADNVLASWAAFLYELQGKVVEVFPTEAPFLAEMSGVGDPNTVGRFTRDMDGNRSIFSGKSVRHSLILSQLAGGGFVSESGSWNAPIQLGSTQVNINLVRCLVPFSVSVDVERDSFDNASATAVATLTREARIALAKIENVGMLGDGTGKVNDITGGSSPGLTIQVSTTGNAAMDVLLPGTVWDINTKSSGANPGNGRRRKIASVSDSSTTQTVTFDTALQATDGDSGNITFSTSEGIYIPGSWSNGSPGTGSGPGELAIQGLEQAAALTGTFEGVNKANVQQWQGTDGRGGDTAVVALSTQMLDGAVRRGRRAGLGVWDFGLGDPAAIDLYKQGLYAQMRYDVQTTQLKSGYSGPVFDGADKPFPLIKEPSHKKGGIKLIDKASFQLYGDQKGPAFLEDDGGMFRRFSRALPKEAELLDRVQLGVIKCNTIVFLNNLAVAA
jgi:hypothetical protein